jgi:hypothetical protein
MNEQDNKPSTAMAPDLDWSQIRETVRMLHLSVAQIEMAMRDGDDSVMALSNSFTAMIGNVNLIGLAAGDLPGDDGNIKQTIQENCTKVSGRIQEVIVAFQFYDRLSQRLSHVSHSLESLANLVSDHGRLFNPHEWRALQQQIRSRYSMQEEQDMFDALLKGASIQEALEIMSKAGAAECGAADDIELF